MAGFHWKVVVNGKDEDSGDMKNVFYVTRPDDHPPLGLGIIGQMYDPMQDFVSTHFSISTISVHAWTGPESGEWYEVIGGKKVPKAAPPWGVGVDYTLSGDFIGTATDDRLPPQMAGVIYAKTAVAHVIAKKFYGDITEADSDAGVPTLALKNALATCAANWMLGFEEATTPYNPEVWGPIHGFNPLVSATYSPYLGSQRRRKRGVGS